jgi:transcriptional regulator with XRE-family HTH domain
MTGPRTVAQWSVNVDRIERARVLNAWTRKRLASVARVDPKTLTDMCSGRRRPTFGTVQAVCAALSLTVAEVILFEDDDLGRPAWTAPDGPESPLGGSPIY